MRAFLGLVNYYNRFLPNLSTVLAPLHQLLQKQARWNWTTDCSTAFEKVKRLIASELVLTHFTPDRPLVLSCDASAYGLGALLSHNGPGGERPIAFASQTLADSEQKYSPIEKEVLALVWGIKRLEQYLLGNQFTLITDHQPLASILHPEKGLPSVTAARPHTCRYAVLLSGYSYDIRYRNTTSHANADVLSRLPLVRERPDEEIEDCAEYLVRQLEQLPVTVAALREATSRDPVLAKVLQFVQAGWPQVVQEEILKPYTERQLELSTEHMWGIHVVNITGQGPRRATWRSH